MDILNNRPAILALIKEVASDHGFTNYEIANVRTNEKGEGYLSEIYMLTIKDSTKHLDLVLKVAFIEGRSRTSLPMRECFENEIYFYSEVCQSFKKFQEDREIRQPSQLVPTFYKASLEEKQEMLCLGDLKRENYEIFEKTKILDHDHVSLMFKTYGRFHACSFAMKDQEPEQYQQLISKIPNLYIDFMDNEDTCFSQNLREFGKLIHKYLIPGEDDKIIEKFEKILSDDIVEDFRKIITQKDDFSAIIHGDSWSNNMMFKYEETQDGKKPCSLQLLDLQLCRIGSPICDLSFCLYSGASKDIFDNLTKYLEIYHESFSSFLKDVGSDPEKLFPFSRLQQQWKKYARFGVFMSNLVLKLKYTYKDEVIDFSDDLSSDDLVNALVNSKFDEKTYQKRIRELYQHLLEVGVL